MSRRPYLLLLLPLLLAGCGYQVGEIRPTPMRHVKTLAVPTFKNNTLIPRIEVLVADTVIKQIQQDGTYQILGEGQADAILEGTITRIQRSPIRSVLSNVLATSEYRLTIEVAYNVHDRVTGLKLFEGRVTGITDFFTSPDLVTDERQAIPIAAQRMAVNLTSRLSEGW